MLQSVKFAFVLTNAGRDSTVRMMCRWLDAGEDDAAIERTLYLSTTPTPQPSPESSPSPEQPSPALTLPQLPHTQLMLSPVPEQG